MSGATQTKTRPRRVDLEIQGMHCASCVAKVENSLRSTPGVLDASVNLATGEAAVTYERDRLGLDELRAATKLAGYEAQPISEDASLEEAETDRERRGRAELTALRGKLQQLRAMLVRELHRGAHA